MAMKLFVMRHGWSGPPKADPKAERERPLLPEGIATVKAICAAWDVADKTPNAIFCSPFQRTMDTADIVGRYFGLQVNFIGDLAPVRPLESTILDLMSYDQIKRIVIVGHVDNTTPSMNALGGDCKWKDLVMGEVRRVSINRKTGDWKLKWALKPSDIGCKDHKS